MMMGIPMTILGALLFVGGIIVVSIPTTKPVATVQITKLPAVTTSQVSDLLQRLAPLVKAPSGAWWENGLHLEFWGNGQVKLQLTMPNGNVLAGLSNSLAGAVEQVAHPSTEIGAALEGWNQEPQP